MSTDLLEASIGLLQLFAAIPMANTIIVSFIYRHKISPIFEKISEFHEKSKNFHN